MGSIMCSTGGLHVRRADMAGTCKKLLHMKTSAISSTTDTCDKHASRVKAHLLIPTRRLLPRFITNLTRATP
jgi:hypothetical protein